MEKYCHKCGSFKSLDDFASHVDKRNGKRYWHKTCRKCNSKGKYNSKFLTINENTKKNYEKEFDEIIEIDYKSIEKFLKKIESQKDRLTEIDTFYLVHYYLMVYGERRYAFPDIQTELDYYYNSLLSLTKN